MSEREYLPDGAELKARRIKLCILTQGGIAVLLRLSRAQVSHIEQGVSTEQRVRAYAALLDDLESKTP